jgi:hypothetical protein
MGRPAWLPGEGAEITDSDVAAGVAYPMIVAPDARVVLCQARSLRISE